MKKAKLILIAILFSVIANSQPLWNTQLNAISGTVTPNLGTSTNHPLNFYTNNTQQMVLSSTGVLKITGLAGSGARFLQADGVGNLVPWTGSMANGNKVLFGDGTWGNIPFTLSGSNIYSEPGTKLGIGISSPVTALDVSGDAQVSGKITAPDGFRFSSTAALIYNPTTGHFRLTKNPGPNDPIPYSDPCVDSPYLTFFQSSQGGFESFQSNPSVAPNVNATMRMFVDPYNGSGYIETTGKDASNANNTSLNLNTLCGRNTNINTYAGNVNVAMGTNSQLFTGDFVSMRKHLEIGDPTNHITDVSNVALDINADAGKGLRFRTNTDNMPLISIEDNSNSVLKQSFTVLGDGHTEISTANTDAFLVKNLNQSGNTSFKIQGDGKTDITTTNVDAFNVVQGLNGPNTFKIKSDGKTEIRTTNADAFNVIQGANGPTNISLKSDGKVYIAGNVGVGVQPSTSNFFRINAGSNSNNADLFNVASNSIANALKIDYKGITTFEGNVSSSFVFKVKNNGLDMFEVAYNGVVYGREMIVTNNAFPDYVFANDYKLLKLSEVKNYIKENKRLPNMPSAQKVKEEGAALGEIQRLTVEKVEELYLYIFELEEKIETLNNKLKALEK